MAPSATERIDIQHGDITKFRGDAIVNASNPTLLPGQGVCGAIHRAAGHRMAFECAKLGGCKPGEAKLTPGLMLHARWVIHTVGPVWRGGSENEAEVLATCYANCLVLAAHRGFKTIAFPAISTGIYGYPMDLASRIALTTVGAFLDRDGGAIERVSLICFTEADLGQYEIARLDVFSRQTARF